MPMMSLRFGEAARAVRRFLAQEFPAPTERIAMQPKSRAALRAACRPAGNGTGGIASAGCEASCSAGRSSCCAADCSSGCSADCGASCDAGVSTTVESTEKSSEIRACPASGCTGTETNGLPQFVQNFDSRSVLRTALRTEHGFSPASVSSLNDYREPGAVSRKTTGTGSRLDGPCSRRCPATYDGNSATPRPIAEHSGSSRYSVRGRQRNASPAG